MRLIKIIYYGCDYVWKMLCIGLVLSNINPYPYLKYSLMIIGYIWTSYPLFKAGKEIIEWVIGK